VYVCVINTTALSLKFCHQQHGLERQVLLIDTSSDALDATDGIKRILLEFAMELVVELMDWWCVAVMVVRNGLIIDGRDFAKLSTLLAKSDGGYEDMMQNAHL
jgi:hypothetical protein